MKKLVLIAATVATVALAFFVYTGRDSVDGCADKILYEGILNLQDNNREVVKNLSAFSECDGLSDSEQREAKEIATRELLLKIFKS